MSGRLKMQNIWFSVGEDLKEKSFLMLINKDGESTKPLKYDGMSIDSIVKNIDGEFFLHSRRLNRHYKISKGGKIDSFTLLKDKYNKEDWKGMGSWWLIDARDLAER